ncbi:hypothetical protein I5P86_05470 [Pseudomonas glycinae]|uniref:hypothetical protein n=1 Tax=Pseudomonas glycinae TaxID=1785145 RepID=UPI0018D63560|nr:hypothetical protein [Pseudomonas glycinae]MBH3404497.1 hypothetical protein [Pseudomonas glycinae]
MRKDWTVWGGCIGLFISGGIYFNILPQITWKAASISDLVGGLSAIAAAVAAWASWMAASIAKRSAEDNKVFARAQLYISHRGDFKELLRNAEKEVGIIFYRENELYKTLFPNNHYSGDVFDASGNESVFEGWKKRYQDIVESTDTGLNDSQLYEWIISCIELLGEMNYQHSRSDEPQICFWAFEEFASPTGFTSSPARHVFNLAEVMNRLLVFCGREEITPCYLENSPFESHYKLYFDNIKNGHSEHYVGVPGEEITRA